MKYLILLIDGLNDLPLAKLEGRTPLEVAHTPTLDEIARRGRVGLLSPSPVWGDGRLELAYLNALGLPYLRDVPQAGPLTALGADHPLRGQDQVFAASFVSVFDDIVADPSAGCLSRNERDLLVMDLNLVSAPMKARLEVSSFGDLLLVLEDAGKHAPPTFSPYHALGGHLIDVVPRGPVSTRLLDVMDASMKALGGHDVNRVRSDLGENPAHLLWPWGGGLAVRASSEDLAPKRIAISQSSLFLGAAAYLGWRTERAGEYGQAPKQLLADLEEASSAAFERNELLCIHCPSPLDVAIRGDLDQRIELIEDIDQGLARPLLDRMQALQDWRLLVLSTFGVAHDHHQIIAEARPFAIAGSDLSGVRGYPFTEADARRSDLRPRDPAELLEYFLGRQEPLIEWYRSLAKTSLRQQTLRDTVQRAMVRAEGEAGISGEQLS